MSNTIKYWKGEEELNRDPKFLAARKNEFSEALPLDEVLSEDGFELNSNRRDFLKFFGFSVTAVALAACYRTPIRKAVPYLVKPENVTPGVANYYSSECGACSAACGIEVKVREGRPIKVDGSKRSPISMGGLCASGQGSIASLYDTERLANPLKNGAEVADWASIDGEISKKLAELAASGSRIAILSSTIHSPSTLKAIEDFKVKYPTAEHVVYDPISYSGIITANEADFGKAAIPSYKFDKAEVIVSFGADFLGTWISPVEYTKAYAPNRIPSEKGMSKHIQFESGLSITGTNADYRFPIAASKNGLHLASLYNYIANKSGAKQIPVAQNAEAAGNSISQAGDALLAAKGKSLVITGSNDQADQRIANAINMLLENYGNTIDLTNHSNQYKGIDKNADNLMHDAQDGKVGAILFYNANPVYNSNSKSWDDAIKKLKLSVSFASSKDETAALCQYVCPDHHYLESWNDSEPKAGVYQFTQPTISPVFNTRQAQVSLITWAGTLPALEKDPFQDKGILSQKHHTSPFYSYIKNNWSSKLSGDLDTAFNKCLHDGVWTMEAQASAVPSFGTDVASLAAEINTKTNSMDLVMYTSVGMRDGSQANNPWLQELPDPVSKVTWDNYVALPKSFAAANDIELGDTVNVKVGNVVLNNVPALIQPGQANGTASLALGYGRTAAGKVGGSTELGFDSIGVNAFGLVAMFKGNRSYTAAVEITKGDETYTLAQTQTHHSIEGRDLVRESTLGEWKKNKNAGNNAEHTEVYTLWEKRDYLKDGSPNHRWAMAIDLNACTGCSACVISCSLENNVPVVGRDEIIKRREMHWIRIDRYYSFTNTAKKEKTDDNFITREKEIKAIDKTQGEKGGYEHWENVKVLHQPMMCQHCSQAPCETVCPVLATTHSSEGLNQMTYNRCIGTKYCGNNCPYKVRRFNWFRYNDNDHFDFHYNNPLGKMVINPDVTVRTRGVMEKCSFCIQRIQEGKLNAKRAGADKNDVKVETACQRACPSNAIVFGDLHNPESEISKLYKNERGFSVLEELNVQSSVAYMTKIRNTETV